jgi:hypothetical protein
MTSKINGANGSEPERAGLQAVFWYAPVPEVTDGTSQTLLRWRESTGWDKPRMARELRKATRDTGEDVAISCRPT